MGIVEGRWVFLFLPLASLSLVPFVGPSYILLVHLVGFPCVLLFYEYISCFTHKKKDYEVQNQSLTLDNLNIYRCQHNLEIPSMKYLGNELVF